MDQLTDGQIFWMVTTVLAILVFGGIGSYVANEKNRHWAEGFCFGASMGPLGIIAAACLPTLEPQPQPLPEVPRAKPEGRKLSDAEWAKRISTPN